MIINEINEITVWLDQLEDEGQDISSLRSLCSYNYLSWVLLTSYYYNVGAYGHGDIHTANYGNVVKTFERLYCSTTFEFVNIITFGNGSYPYDN